MQVLHNIANRFVGLSGEQQQQFLQALQTQGIEFAQLPIVPVPVDKRTAVSYAQARQWFLWQLDPKSTAYHISSAIRLMGRLNIEVLRASFTALVARHDSLRTQFHASGDGQVEQRVIESALVEAEILMIDLSGVAPAQREEQLLRETRTLHNTLFDLSSGPLLRIGLIHLAAEEHVLVVVMHHIISDGWSLQVLINEFAAHYCSQVSGESLRLPLQPIQYADYAVWQRSWMQAGEQQRQLGYWRARLGDEHPVLQLQTDQPRRADAKYRAARHDLVVPKDLVQKVRQRANAEDATLFMLLLAGFQLLLYRYSGLRDIRVGVPIANRQREETEGVIGLFVNTQVLRADIDSGDSLREVIAKVREATLGAQAHQDLPFEQLVETLRPERSLSHSPLFQVMFNHQRTDNRALQQLPELVLEDYSFGERIAQFELTLNTREDTDGRVTASFDYAKELFAVGTIAQMARHYTRILAALAQNIDDRVDAIAMLEEHEENQLQAWSACATHHTGTLPLHHSFEQRVQEQPGRIALIFNDDILSYAELNARANRLAHYLIRLGVKPETKVGLAMERGVDVVVGVLGILKAGAAYVPLAPEYPVERLAWMIEDSEIALLLTQRNLHSKLPRVMGIDQVIDLDTINLESESVNNPQVTVSVDNLAYVIYTSGSTGRPKGAQLCHRNVTRLLQATDGWFQFGPSDVWTLFHSYAFDFSVWELFGALCTGGQLVIVPFWISRSPQEFLQLIRDCGVTILNQTPSAFCHLLQLPEIYEQTLALRVVIFGGEALEPEQLRQWIERRGDHRPQLINMYGITETTVHVTYRQITQVDLDGGRSPVGVAVPDLGLRVLDASLNAVPVGVPGELHVVGAGLSRGYLNRASLSAERFIADPHGVNGERLYRTGDLVRWTAQGQLDYLGRIDQQVKIRGFRIELGEIEARLLVQPEIKEAVVLAREGTGGVWLVAYVALRAGSTIDSAALRGRLAETLPDYMIPGAIVLVDTLPLTTNGKVDRSALPAPELADKGKNDPPRGAVEVVLARVWSDVLGVARVGRNDNFFELGGHSLLALKMLERMRAHGWTVAVRTLFQHPLLCDLARVIESEDFTSELIIPANKIPVGCQFIEPAMVTLVELTPAEIRVIEAAVPGGAANIQDIYPLAPLQEGILFHHLLQPEKDAYVTVHTLRFDERQRLESFVDSFNRVIARHDILRTAVIWENLRQPIQVVYREARIVLQWMADDDALERLETYVASVRIDICKAPLFNAVAGRDGDRWTLKLFSHHMVEDNTTLQHLVREIALIQQGRWSELPEPLPYRNFVAEARLGVSEAEHEAFFSRMLGDVDEPTAPFGLLDVRGDGTGTDEARMVLGNDLVVAIRREAQHYGVTVAALFHLAWALVVGKTAACNDPVFGTVLFGRMNGSEGAGQTIGLLINTLPIRVSLQSVSVEHALRQTQATLTDLVHHEHASLSLAISCSALPGDTPLFSALLNYRHTRQLASDDTTDAWVGIENIGGRERSNFPFGLSVNDGGDGFELVAHVGVDIGAERVCEMMSSAVQGVVAALEKHPRSPVSAIDIISESERTQQWQWVCNDRNYPDTAPVHYLFERCVRQWPEATALVFNDEILGYSELNVRANRLAHYLIGLGVKPETRVGIAVERSVEMVVGLLGILKAGAAYVPLDPEYPRERLAYMVEDSGLEWLLSQSHLRPLLPTLPDRSTVIELDRIELGIEDADNPQVLLNGEHLAYVIYTSGTTGKPKGAANRHQSLSSCMQWMQETYGLTAEDTVLHKAPFSFDVSVWELFWPLTTGARLALARPGDQRDPTRIIELIVRHQVTVVNFVPVMLQAFLQLPDIEHRTRLRHIICGGEAMPASTQHVALSRLNGVALQNLYGPTEAAIHVTQWTCRSDGATRVPIGRPISGIHAEVLDTTLNPVPCGVVGELYLGGVGLGRGYLNRSALTAERFVAHPSGGGGRLYRTGDLVRWNQEGQLEYLGRIDHQVKIRGLRIELGEVEAQLSALPGVKDAVVVAQQTVAGARLIGYVTGTGLDGIALREQLGGILPDYMVPAVIVCMDFLPLNASGKVDRAVLPAPEWVDEKEYEAPQGELEQLLAGIWQEVLHVDRVGRNDNFFVLGGHSLLALAVLERLRHQGRVAAVVALFQHPQLQAFARELTQTDGIDSIIIPPNNIPDLCRSIRPDMLTLVALTEKEIRRIEQSVPGGAANIQDIYPLAPLQEGILFHHLLQTDGDVYVTTHTLAFDSRQRLEHFVVCFNQVIARHDVLRTAIMWEELSEPVQVVHRQAELSVQWLPLPAEDDCDMVAELQQQTRSGHYRIDVRHTPMIDAIAAHDPVGQRWLLQLPSHHLVSDHTTLALLIDEIALLQQGRDNELPVPLPFRNVVARARLGMSREAHEAFFTDMLGDVVEPTAPFNLLNVHGDGKSIRESKCLLDTDLAAQVRQQAQRLGVSAAAFFHLAWALVVSKTAGRQDVVFGTVLFGRMQGQEGDARTLGLSMNTLPVRVRLRGKSARQALESMHRTLAGLLRHEHATLALAQTCSGLPGGTPLFATLLNYRHSPGHGEVNGQRWKGITLLGSEERTNYPLAMAVDDMGEGFQLTTQVCAQLDADEICGYMERALRSLTSMLTQASAVPVTHIDLLGDQMHARLAQWGVNDRRNPDTRPIHTLFEAQTRRQPDAIALSCNGWHLTYAELNTQANRLAHHLLRLGVGSETRVGIGVERSPDMIVALLAVLKTGGAYVPLDPDYPRKRLAYIAKDSAIGLLLTQRGFMEHCPLPDGCVSVELDAFDCSGQPDHNPMVPVSADNLAYLIYTSGSTGRPKGVMVHHGSLSHFLGSMADQPGLLASDRLVAATSLSFDIAALELYLPLVLGAQVILADQSTVRDGRLLAQLLTESQATVFQATPAGWRMLLAGGWSYQQQTAIAGTTFKGLCGGEALPPDLARALTDKGVELWNMYGPTETTIWSMVKRVEQVPPTLGRPIAATQVQVLDADLNPCPPGVPGELYLGGVGLARGYLNRAGLTAERFIAALNSSAGERIYRTGDLVRWTPEGELEYLGRLDQQVKIRGFRIELGEVEAQVMALSMVREAAVVAMDGVAGACLAAYVVPTVDVTDPDAFRATLRARLAETLPDHMVPGVVEILEEMPLTPNGKVDRKALPQPLPASAEACDPPRGESELALARIWSSLLKVEQVGRHNNFFQLGGHSLLALQMVNRAQALHLFNPPLKLHDVIAAPTIALLCGRKASDRADEIVAPLNGISVGKDPLFCIHSGWGTTMGYLPLAQRLDGICTVYGISSRVLHDPASRHHYLTLEKMADDYTAVIRRIQVRGPYSILGWSLGGTLAAMVTARLEADGDEVAFLGLVDPYMAAMEPPQNDLTWQMRYVRFLAGISSKMTPQWTVPATIGDPFEQEDALAQTTAALLDDGRLSLLGDFEGASAAEIVRLFLTNYSVQLASMASVAPLPALRADTRCWWVTERLDKAVAMARLAKELNCAIEHLSVDADHLGIIADHGLLDAVAGTLSMPLQSLT